MALSPERFEALRGQLQQKKQGLSPEKFEVLRSSLRTQTVSKQGFAEGVKTSFRERRERGVARRERLVVGEQRLPETVFQEAGEVVGGAIDIGIEGLKAITPDKLGETIKKRAASIFPRFAESQIGKLLGLGAEKFEELSPRAQDNVRAAMELAALIPVTRGAKIGLETVGRVAKETVPVVREVARVGAKVTEKRLASQITKEALEVTRVRVGELTAKEKKEVLKAGGTETKRSFLGLSKKEVISVTDENIAVAKSVEDVVSITNGASENISAIFEKIGRVSEKIDVGLKGNNTIFNINQLKARLGEVRDKGIALFKSDTNLVKQYDDLIDFFLDIQKKHPNNLTGLLAARKEFDREVRKQFPNIFKKFDGTNDGRIIAFANIRRQANNIIADALPEGNPFKAQLKQQNRMFDAIDNISLKGAKNLETGVIERSLAAIDAHGIRTLVISGSLLGLSFLTSAPVILSLLAGGTTIKIAGKIFNSQAVKRAIIKSLRTIQTTGAKLNKVDTEAAQKTIALLTDKN